MECVVRGEDGHQGSGSGLCLVAVAQGLDESVAGRRRANQHDAQGLVVHRRRGPLGQVVDRFDLFVADLLIGEGVRTQGTAEQ